MEIGVPRVVSLGRMNVPKSKLQDHVYDKVCELILRGDIAPEQLITIQALADSFGVSAMPVREALQKLIGAGVLAVISGRSIGIPPLTLDRIDDLRRVRIELECAVSRWAVEHVTPQVMTELESLATDMLSAVRKGDIKSFLYSNRLFHFTIYRLSGSGIAVHFIEQLWLQATPYFHHLYKLDKYEAANAQHTHILQALRTGDEAGVAEGIRRDIETGSELLARMLVRSAEA